MAKAKSLLEEAGWKDSNNNGIVDKNVNGALTELELDVLVSSTSKITQDLVLLWTDNARKVGVNLNLITKESNLVFKDVKSQEYEVCAYGKGRDVGYYPPKQLWHTVNDRPGGGNVTGFGNC